MNRRTALLMGIGLPTAAGLGAGQSGASLSLDAASAMPLAQDDAEKRVLGVLSDAMRSGRVFRSVSPRIGRMLRLLAGAGGAKAIAEIGTSTGYSGLWFALALQRTNGRLTTFEIDHARAETARKHFAQAGVAHLVTLVEGDAHENIKQLKEPLDLVFLDADKEGYISYLNRLLPLVKPGGVIVADNFERAQDYKRAVTTSPGLETLVLLDPGEGGHENERFAVTLKKR